MGEGDKGGEKGEEDMVGEGDKGKEGRRRIG